MDHSRGVFPPSAGTQDAPGQRLAMLTTMPQQAPPRPRPVDAVRVVDQPDAGPAAGLEGQPERRGSRLRFLDGLRLLAARGGVGLHLTAAPTAGWDGHPFGGLTGVTRYGWLGVELFFLISEFVICMSGW